MRISFDLTVLGHLLGTLGIRIDVDQTAGGQPVIDRTVKGISKAWVKRMTA
jgi:hypothetical protein